MQIETLPVASLTPYARNSRTHSDAQVAQIVASIHEFGFTNPVLIDEHGGIIAGHGRVLAATKLGLREVPCIRLSHLNEAQRRAYVIADNKLALNAGWDEAMLAEELRALAAMDFDLALTGFDSKELDDLLDGLDDDAAPGLTDPDAAPPPPDVPVSRSGDVWIMGRHRLMCGDSTNLEHVQALMGGEQADLVWTDPPYNVAVEGKAGKILNDSMQAGEFRDFLRGVYASFYAVMRPGAVIYVAHSESERAAFADCMVQAGLKLSQVLIWVKQSATLSRQDFNWQHEPIIYGWKEGAGHYFCEDFTLTTVMDDDLDLQKLKKEQLIGMVMELRGRTASSVVRHDRPTRSELHPTMKPVALVERMVAWSSKPGQIVLDLFGGSGSTLIAAQKSNRRARLMELDPKYCDVIVRRWQEYTGGGATLEGDTRTFAQIADTRR